MSTPLVVCEGKQGKKRKSKHNNNNIILFPLLRAYMVKWIDPLTNTRTRHQLMYLSNNVIQKKKKKKRLARKCTAAEKLPSKNKNKNK